jgi:transcriptional adapter 2-alpha
MSTIKEPMFLPTGGKRILHHCSYCHIDITLQLRIKCAECENFHLCGDCFCAGVELHPHLNTHQYHVVDSLHYPIFSKDWTIGEELLLLEGIEKHGLGNWKTIAEYIGTKNARACDEHYYEHYLGVYGKCLPQMCFINDMEVFIQYYQHFSVTI